MLLLQLHSAVNAVATGNNKNDGGVDVYATARLRGGRRVLGPVEEDVCEDDSTWSYANGQGIAKSCTEVGCKETEYRCSYWIGNNNGDTRLAREACPVTCGTGCAESWTLSPL